MDVTFSEDQRLFAETLRGILAADCPPEAVRTSWDDPDGRVPGLWEILGGTGVLGLTVPDSHDGLGMGEVDLVLDQELPGKNGGDAQHDDDDDRGFDEFHALPLKL